MGAFLSLPMTTLMAVPLLSSWSSSMNLLFFGLNWYILVLTNPPLRVEIYGLLVIRLFFYLIPSLLFVLFDGVVPSLAVQIKSQGKLGLPGRMGNRRLARVVGWSVFNSVASTALVLGLETLLTKVLRVRSGLSVSKQMPLPWTMLQSVFFGLLLRGLLQYVIHRFFLHNPSSPISKQHKRWQHSIPAPFSLAASYDYPIAYLLHHWVPLYLPAMLLHIHILPFLAILAIVSLEETMTYSGYSYLPSAILVKGMARRVDNHFIASGGGNFASFGLLDWCCGTSVGGDIVEDLKAEWEKRGMTEKVQSGAIDASDVMDKVSSNLKKAGRRKGNAANGSS